VHDVYKRIQACEFRHRDRRIRVKAYHLAKLIIKLLNNLAVTIWRATPCPVP